MPEWVPRWKAKLPLHAIHSLLEFLKPLISNYVKKNPSADENAITQLIGRTTVVGVLPVPHSIVVRHYIPNSYTNLWFCTYIWGVTFLRNQESPLFDGTFIRMFQVTVAATEDDDFL